MKVLISLLIMCTLHIAAKKCTALAMSGGGAHGAFEAGVLWGMIKNDADKDKYRYDVVSGVSAGSINALGVAAWEIGKEEGLVEFLSE
jgi:predicted acylesterase/phospholipase RssA